jgi:hypothetical protein
MKAASNIRVYWPYYLLLFLILLSPRFSLFQLTATRTFDLRIEDIFVAILAVTAIIGLIRKGLGVIPRVPGFVFLSLYLVTAFVSTLIGTLNHSLVPLKGWFYFLKEIEFFLIFLFIAGWKDARSNLRTIFYIIAACGIFNVLFSWVMFVFFHASGPDTAHFTILGLVEISKFPLAAFYYIIAVIMLGELFFGETEGRVLKIFSLAAFLLAAFSCIFILSRGSILMLAVSLIVLALFYFKLKTSSARIILPLTGLFFALLFILLLVFFRNKIPIFAYFKDFGSVTSRISDIWAPLLDKFWHSMPLIGMGKGASPSRNFDSLYVKLLVETGIIGSGFFLSFWGVFSTRLASIRTKLHDSIEIRNIFYAMLAGMLAGGIVSETMFVVKVGEIFWFFSGLAFAVIGSEAVKIPGATPRKGFFKNILKWFYRSIYTRIIPDYSRELEKAVSGCGTLLDVGCGSDSPVQTFNTKISCSGVDAFKGSLDISRQKKIHDRYFRMNVVDIGKKFKRDSFDCVTALDLIEHLNKKNGLKLVSMMEKIARRKIIIFTPNGFLKQGSIHNNPYQVHVSGWTPSEMKKLGFRVIGINGWKPLRTEMAAIRYRPWFFWRIISDISQLFVRNRPEKAFQILCIKDK